MTAAPARQAFAWASAVLARRWRGAPVAADDWLCPQAVQALVLPLSPRADAPLQLVLREGVSARSLPRQARFGPLGVTCALRVLRAAPALAQAQGRPPQLTLQRTQEIGTATALVRDRLNGERHYLLTCAHVVAPDAAARFGDAVQLDDPAARLAGRLCEWQPQVGGGAPLSRLDAALVELDAGTLQALRSRGSDWLPRQLSDEVWAQRPVALQRCGGPLDGALAVHWSGEVGAGGADFPNYFLEDAIGYTTPSPTAGGDSGGALWGEGDALLGMHIGAVDRAGALGANAVMARVKPALDWFCVKPFTRLDPATLGPGDWPALPADGFEQRPPATDGAQAAAAAGPGAAADAHDLQVLAQTLWGEARGEGQDGMQAVAAVVMNRWRSGYRDKGTVAEVCQDPWQFSCWNADDPNRRQLLRQPVDPDPYFRQALVVAQSALDGTLRDPTLGARHYVAVHLRQRPDWLLAKRPCAVIGRHEFYNDIA